MGDVYRARDPRLQRDVAIKVVRSALALKPENLERLNREARAVGRLNHPNILAVFDVGTHAGAPYVVSELLQGQSLRDRLGQGPLPYRQALKVGSEIAQALGAAHEKGIWHRDVKPGNVFLTTDGRVKLLDFGLAQQSSAAAPAGPDDATASEIQDAAASGTAGYMSPEQVLGMPLDQRSDIFALGAVLYEMFTGAQAFPRTDAVNARMAVVKADPVDPRDLIPSLTDDVVAVIRRCLEKNREERFQSARDLAFQLHQILRADEVSRPRPLPEPVPEPRTLGRRYAAIAVLAAGVGSSLALLSRHPPAASSAASFQQLTFRRGRIGGARFASKDQAVVYSEARPVYRDDKQRNQLEVWRIELGSPQSRPLGIVDADVLAAGPGDLALSLHRRYVGGRRFVGTLATTGSDTLPHEVANDVEEADWDPAGTNFVIARRTGGGGESALEYPIGTTLYATAGSIRSPRMSPDGRRIAFFEDPSGHGGGGNVVVIDLLRQRKELTDHWPSVRGLAWSASGKEIWFAAATGVRADRALRAVSLDGRQRLVLQAAGSLALWDVSKDGNVLVTHDEEWNALVGRGPRWSGERDISWFDAAGVADLSDDGETVLFGDRFGIYTRRTDGSPPVPLGLKEGYADDLSPDGRTALATTLSTNQLVLLPTGPGEPRPVPAYTITSYKGALWCPDGRHIVFNGVDSGRELRPYIQDVSLDPPSPPRPLGPKDTWVLAVSPDGEWVAAREPSRGVSVWPINGGPSRDVPGSDPEDRPVAFSADGRSLWIFRRGEVPARVFSVDIATGRRSVWKMLWPPDPVGVYSIVDFNITPTGHAYFYSYAGLRSQLYLVRGLK